MEDFYGLYPIYLVNISEKRYELIVCDSLAERDYVETAAWAMIELFGGAEDFCIKYVEPEFEEVE